MGGCVQSRYERRNQDLDDFNTLDVAFMGGEGRTNEIDLCPVDKLTYNYIKDVSNLQNGLVKESQEIFRIKKNVEVDENCEITAGFDLKWLEMAGNSFKCLDMT